MAQNVKVYSGDVKASPEFFEASPQSLAAPLLNFSQSSELSENSDNCAKYTKTRLSMGKMHKNDASFCARSPNH